MEMQSLKGRVALVTGGSTGLGFGAAKKLIEEGASVYITGRRQAELDRAVSKLGSAATAIQADANVEVKSRFDLNLPVGLQLDRRQIQIKVQRR